MEPLMECDGVAYSYDGGRTLAVDDVSFAVGAGEFVCVVGENGSGKSTLVRLAVGLLKPMRGRVVFRGLAPNEVGYLPQQTQIQKDFPANVMEVVLSGRLGRKGFLPFYSKTDTQAAEGFLERLGILGLRRKAYRDLSGGQQQRVLLARALCASDRLLVLDEPVTGLDPLAQSELYRVTAELAHGGMGILMVSHDAPGAAAAADKMLHMDGKALFFGSVGDYARSALGERFLGRAAKGGDAT